MSKRKILFVVADTTGILYYRFKNYIPTLDKEYPNKYEITIERGIDFTNPKVVETLKNYNVIHFYKTLIPDLKNKDLVFSYINQLKSIGVKFIMDIDDYWDAEKEHPVYSVIKSNKLKERILPMFDVVDYVTTTTNVFKNLLKKYISHDKIFVIPNGVDETLSQFENNRVEKKNGKVNIYYLAGSSHLLDVEQLRGVFNFLYADPSTKDKFTINLVGYDIIGKYTERYLNPNLEKILISYNIPITNKLLERIDLFKGDLLKIKEIPYSVSSLFKKEDVILSRERDYQPEETFYYYCENLLTNNMSIIKNEEYKNDLLKYKQTDYKVGDNETYYRFWTKNINEYATVLDGADIVIAPLKDNEFNKYKSELKFIESYTRKIAVVASDVSPYNKIGKHNENCMLVPTKSNSHKYWKKYLKKLILDDDFRNKIGNELYEDMKDNFSLKNIAKLRNELYSK